MALRFRSIVVLSALAAAILSGCTLVFSPPLGQQMDFTFRLAAALGRGEKHLVAAWIPEDAIDTRKRVLQISGAIGRPAGSQLPREVEITATVTDAATGRVSQRLKLTAELTPEDRFRVAKKIKRDVEAGSRVEITVEAVGDDLPAGSEVRLCIDLVKSSKDLRDFASCAVGAGATGFAAIQESLFTPSCAVAGCHDSSSSAAGLDLAAGQAWASIVDQPSGQVFGRMLIEPGKPDDSYLVQKIRGSSSISGGRMPLGGPYLDGDSIAGLVEWVENGARDN